MTSDPPPEIAEMLRQRHAIERLVDAVAPPANIIRQIESAEAALAPVRSALLAAANSGAIAAMLDNQKQAVAIAQSARLFAAAGEQAWKALAPYREVAAQMVAMQARGDALLTQVPTLRAALLTALPDFLDELHATARTEGEEGPPSPRPETPASTKPSVSTDSSGAQMARARFILWLAVLCVAVFITSGTVTEQITRGGDAFDGTGLADLGGLVAIVYFAEKALASGSS